MRAWSAVGLAAALVAAAETGCSSDASAPGGTGGTIILPMPDGGDADGGTGDAAPADAGSAGIAVFNAFVTDLAKAVCSWQFRCCTRRDIDALSGSRYLTEPECIAYQREGLSVLFTEARLSIVSGRMTIDESIATACIGHVAANSCTAARLGYVDALAQIQSCPDPFVGKVAPGERCYVRDECEPGARCVGATGVTYSAMPTPEGLSPRATLATAFPVLGACLPYKKEGELCAVELDCAPGLYCKGPAFVCARPAVDGEVCRNESSVGGIPGLRIACDDVNRKLVCAGDVCSRLPRANEPCLQTGYQPPCDPDPALDLACVGTQFSSGICKPAARAGEVCGGSGIPPCTTGLVCVPGPTSGLGTCEPPPKLGEPCVGDCSGGAVCDGEQGLCVEPGSRRDGETCETHNECASMFCSSVFGSGGSICLPPQSYEVCTGFVK